MAKFFAPMLAGDCLDTTKLKFPVLVSQKLDGVRATVQDGQLLTRSLKPIRNENVQELFAGLPDGLDGELIVGDPTAEDAYRKTVSLVMSEDKPLDFFNGQQIQFHIFDKFGSEGFQQRLQNAAYLLAEGSGNGFGNLTCKLVKHVIVNTSDELD